MDGRGALDADMGVGMRGTVSLGDIAASRADTVGTAGGGSVTASRGYGLGDYGTIAGRALGLAGRALGLPSGPTGSPQGRSTFSGQSMATIGGGPAAVVSAPRGLQMVDPTVAGTRAGGQTYMAPPVSGLASLAPETSLRPGANRPGALGSFAKGLQHDVSMGITALSGGLSRAGQQQALQANGYTQPEIDSYFARSDATAARNAANAGMGEGPDTADLTASTDTSGTSSTPAATTSSNMETYRNMLASRFGNTPMTAATANAPAAVAQQRNTQAEFNYYMNLFGGQQPYTQMIR